MIIEYIEILMCILAIVYWIARQSYPIDRLNVLNVCLLTLSI